MKKSKKNSRKKSPNNRLRRLFRPKAVKLVALLLFAGVGTYLVFLSQAASVTFTKVATHPQAAAQTTADGKILVTLKSWNGKLYAGYGDYSANTGPITVNGFDGVNFTSTLPREQLPPCAQAGPASEACTSDTEAIYLYHEFAGKLYASSIDPRGNNSNYVVGTPSSPSITSWQNPAGFAEHAFDVATLTGSDLWVVGSEYDSSGGIHAAAWRSLDGGATWPEPHLSVLPANTNVTCGSYPNFARIYGAGAYNGKLYVVVTDCYGGAQANSKVFDGTNWSNGPNLPTFNHAETFAGKMIFQSGYHAGRSAGSLMAFDGTKAMLISGVSGIWNYTIDSGAVYALTNDYRVLKSTDLVAWTQVGTAPSVARSIAIHNGVIYLGGTDSGIYKSDFSTTTPPTTSPSTDTTPPVSSISSPSNGSSAGNRLTIQASAVDNVAVNKMEIYIDSTLAASSTSGSVKYRWNSRNASPGQHAILVKAYDAAGNVGQASVTVSK